MKLLEWNSDTNPCHDEMCDECMENRDSVVCFGCIGPIPDEARICETCLEAALRLIRSRDG